MPRCFHTLTWASVRGDYEPDRHDRGVIPLLTWAKVRGHSEPDRQERLRHDGSRYRK